MVQRSLSRGVSLSLVASLALGASSCLFGGGHEHAPAVTVDGEMHHARSHGDARHSVPSEPEYFEGEVAPVAPAALHEERPSAPSSAHVWVAGHHARRDGQWVWMHGHYAVPPRADDVWVPGHWVDHLRGYVWIDGGWR